MIYKYYTYVALVGLLISVVSSVSGQQVDVPVFQQSIEKKDAQVFDVRTAGEFNTGHLHHALQADYTKKPEFLERVKYLDKQQTIYVYCLSGGRSAAAAKWMRENGFREVIELKGGINAWKQAGLPVEGAADQQQMSVDTFHNAIATGEVLVDVGAEWCPPCRKMEPVIQAYLKENRKVRLLKVDGGRDREVMQAINATSLPTFILYRDGREVWRKQGVYDKL
ncbi:rhodanese-like domain-containing protein [Chitinophaga filiformis]|uniref:Thioredoxin domain-containing protein n=1 Tax=Chitinophaga filiformis TaxID=104663 RepID=A0ABY4HZH1_CHIFI|nr:rhodanese-like domain-containing protein [Chitinophaga filiformis]UPK69231.1 thioredoxin domain-containing protein [Chitinophaga filiformis]